MQAIPIQVPNTELDHEWICLRCGENFGSDSHNSENNAYQHVSSMALFSHEIHIVEKQDKRQTVAVEG